VVALLVRCCWCHPSAAHGSGARSVEC
jgi:hypothetical protein